MINPNPGDSERTVSRRREGSMASRIEAISKGRPPAPKGKGIVMILLGMAVLWALIDTFTRGTSASKAVEDNHAAIPENPPLAPRRNPEAPGQPANPTPKDNPANLPSADPILPGADIELPPELPAGVAHELRLNMMSLASAGTPLQSISEGEIRAKVIRAALRDSPRAFAMVDDAHKPAVRSQLLELFVRILPLPQYRGSMYEAAASIAEGFGEASEEPWLTLHLAAYQQGLANDDDAPGAILFLGSSPRRLGASALAALDHVILDIARPLAVRVLAAHSRPMESRGTKLTELANDPATPPSLRRALNRTVR